MSDWITLLPFLGAVVAVALSGAYFMPGDWYKSLDKPAWTPPDWAFGPAWTVLYLMIAVAGWLVWQAGAPTWVLAVWSSNLVFNGLWSWLMFGRHRIDLALVDALAMLATKKIMMVAAAPISSAAAILFLPYLLWVTFASALNLSILQRNPQVSRTYSSG